MTTGTRPAPVRWTVAIVLGAVAVLAGCAARESGPTPTARPPAASPGSMTAQASPAAVPLGRSLLSARAQLHDAKGGRVGQADLEQTPHGVLIALDLTRIASGEHALHIHEKGVCAPDFEAAGGHFNPTGRQHGFQDPRGPHAGDLPNIYVPESGRLTVEVLAPHVSLETGAPNTLLDADGSALVIHERPDDYRSDPAGEAGTRIACGVVTG